MNQILIGADPEVFVKQNGVFCSAAGLIEGTKERPNPVKGGAVQVDGMALEFNIDPVRSSRDFIEVVNTVMAELQKKVQNHEIVIEAVADFSDEVLRNTPAEALVLGCDPDWNAWTMNVNETPNANVTFRTAAGHVHLGYVTLQSIDDIEAQDMAGAMARQLDFYLGLPSLLYDSSIRRRELYGSAGAFRVKPYGMEYRVLSNQWLKSDVLKAWIFNNSQYEKIIVRCNQRNWHVKNFCLNSGFRLEGVLEKSAIEKGKIVDEYILGMTKGQFLEYINV